MSNFAVQMRHGPRWDPARGTREQDGWDEHAAFMDALLAEGFVVFGGPTGWPAGSDGALLAVEAADEQAIRDRLAADPWAPAGLLHVASLEPWPLWLDSRAS
jgi:uncharacterized protein YciI